MIKFFGGIRRWAILACVIALPARAELPAVKLMSAPLVSPTTAWSLYGGDTTHTSGLAAWSGSPPEIKALARTLGAGREVPDQYAHNVLDYVRNNIDVEFRFGLGKGGRGALIDQSGTPFDQAELMVKLLREGGVAATYHLGTFNPSPQDFGRWTGLVQGLNETNQTFTVNAKAACQMLADGGVPATVNGFSECASVSGALTGVTLGHIWVAANGKLYDPSFKTSTLHAGIDVPAAMGCGSAASSTCGATMTSAAMASAILGTSGGLSTISHVGDTQMNAQLRLFATRLQSAIESSGPLRTIQQVVGGRSPITGVSPAATSSLAGHVPQISWSGDIPDVYRTTLRVRTSFTDMIFYADELAGRRLQLLGDDATLQYALDGQVRSVPGCAQCVASDRVAVEVNHPYVANNKTYADDVADLKMFSDGDDINLPSFGVFPVTIVHGFGIEGPSSERHMAALQEANPLTINESWTVSSKLITNVFRADDQPLLAAKFLSQGGTADVVVAGLGKANLTRHHDVGIVYAHPYSPGSMSMISVQSALSVTAAQDPASRAPTFQASAAVWSMIEGSVNQQATNSPGGSSTASMFWSANQPGSNGVFTYMPASALTQSADIAYQDAGLAGYDLISPNSGSQLFFRPDAAAYTLYSTIKGGAAFVRDPVRRAMDSAKAAEAGAARKKYASISPADGALTLTQTDIVTGVGDFPESLAFTRTYRSDVAANEELLSSQSGSETTGGAGGTSTSLNWRYSGPDTTATSRLGAGWTHNYNVSAALSGNGQKALGSDRALDASSAIAAIWSILDSYKAPTFASRLSSVFATYWLATDIAFNSASVDKGGKSDVFQRLADGSFRNTAGDAKLIQTGQPTLTQDFSNVTMKYTGSGGDVINFTWGMRSKHTYCCNMPSKAEPIFKADDWIFPDGVKVTFEYAGQWLVTSWPQTGAYVTCDVSAGSCDGQQTGTHPYGFVLSRVENNLGRSLTFTTQATTIQTYTPNGLGIQSLPSSFRITRVTDETGRHVDYALSDCTDGRRLLCDTFTVTLPDENIERFSYVAGTDSPNPIGGLYPNYRLRRWYSPRDLSKADGVAVYDELYRAVSLTDRLDRQTRYYPGGVAGVERWKRGQIISPRQGVTEVSTMIFDDKNSALIVLDPLQRKIVNRYDNAGRLIRTEFPEQNAQETVYDFRGNVTSTCIIPKQTVAAEKGRSCNEAKGDLVTLTNYKEGVAVLNCQSPASCNKPSSTRDARLKVTHYEWDDTTGLLTRIIGPAVVEGGPSPQTKLEYDDYPRPNNGGIVKLLGRKIDWILADKTVTTAYVYDPNNKLVLKSATTDQNEADPNALSLRTCFQFDARGNLTGTTDPRATSCP